MAIGDVEGKKEGRKEEMAGQNRRYDSKSVNVLANGADGASKWSEWFIKMDLWDRRRRAIFCLNKKIIREKASWRDGADGRIQFLWTERRDAEMKRTQITDDHGFIAEHSLYC